MTWKVSASCLMYARQHLRFCSRRAMVGERWPLLQLSITTTAIVALDCVGGSGCGVEPYQVAIGAVVQVVLHPIVGAIGHGGSARGFGLHW